jgi:Gpi18-like mannosyltransferase
VKLPRWATALDAAAVVMAILTISVLVFGGFRVTILGQRISVTEWWRPVLWAIGAAAVRHAIVRQDPLPRRLATAARAWWRSDDTRTVLPVFLASRFSVLVIGFLAVVLIGLPPDGGKRWNIYRNELLDLPGRWDAGWYHGIASEGYHYDPQLSDQYQQNIAFFPAFPMAMRLLGPLFGRHLIWTGLVISLASFFVALVYFLRLARSELGDDGQAAAAVTLLASYPFAVFFSAPYTEGLFLLTLVGAVYHFRRDELWRAAAWGFVCGLTRPNGAFLSIALAVMAITPAARPGLVRRLAAASAPGLGMVAFSAFIYQLTGDAFKWTQQNLAWGRVYRSLDTVVSDRFDYIYAHGLYNYATTLTVDLMYAVAVLLAIGAVWPVYRRFGAAYAVLILVTVLPPLSAGGMLSMGRVTSILFPVFLWLGAAIPAHHRTAWMVLFASLQALVAMMFFTWRPMF